MAFLQCAMLRLCLVRYCSKAYRRAKQTVQSLVREKVTRRFNLPALQGGQLEIVKSSYFHTNILGWTNQAWWGNICICFYILRKLWPHKAIQRCYIRNNKRGGIIWWLKTTTQKGHQLACHLAMGRLKLSWLRAA